MLPSALKRNSNPDVPCEFTTKRNVELWLWPEPEPELPPVIVPLPLPDELEVVVPEPVEEDVPLDAVPDDDEVELVPVPLAVVVDPEDVVVGAVELAM